MFIVRLSFVVLYLMFANAQTLEPSFVRYEASDPNGSWSGTAPVSGLELNLNTETLGLSTFTITLDAGGFNSGNFIRDANARRIVFESHLYPEIVFTSKQIIAPDNQLLEESNQVTVQGDLTMHGVTRELSIPVTIEYSDPTYIAKGTFEVSLQEFSMRAPEFFGLVVDDLVTIYFEIHFQN
jgi:polyisoprenoid-binding protein YceI